MQAPIRVVADNAWGDTSAMSGPAALSAGIQQHPMKQPSAAASISAQVCIAACPITSCQSHPTIVVEFDIAPCTLAEDDKPSCAMA